jgi:predicted glycogen debranching enzyme
MIRFGQDICGNLEIASRREWLETNGLGGFSASTIIGLNTRRYHGLLVASLRPPVERFVLLSKLEETLWIDDQRFDLSANRYPGVVHPQGFLYQREFRQDPFPVFTYEGKGLQLVKSVFMVQGENTTVVHYELRNTAPGTARVQLEVRPLIAFRDYHSTTHENSSLDRTVETADGITSVRPYAGLPALHLGHNAVEVQNAGDWYRNFEYAIERERGLDFHEDLFNPCAMRFDLLQESEAAVIASTERRQAQDARAYRLKEIQRRQAVARESPVADETVGTLTSAADQFIVSRGEQKTVIAGYHWFSDWGRDTMISLPGLTLPLGRFDIARSILRTFARHTDQGMLPNRFPDAGEKPEYNTVDATLWFFEAIRAYLAYSGDEDFVRKELYQTLTEIILWHTKGTRFGIKVDAAGLLNAGEPGVQLTWMDAKVGDWVVTPRRGKPVEIQALWYNALCIMADLAQRFNDVQGQKRYRTMAALAQWSFNRLFWHAEGEYLYDVVNGGPPDASLRPNQIFAVSLPYTMLALDRARRVVEVVQKHLLTPYGLRSLAPGDPNYRGRYSGGPAERDSAYHQGTVWPWLMGPFLTAYLKVHDYRPAARQQAEEWLRPLEQFLQGPGVGQLPEIFDGDAPQNPCGCAAQAWSVAELLRAIVEDVRGLRPGAPKTETAGSVTLPAASD